MILASLSQFKRHYFPQATMNEEIAYIEENPKLYGQYLVMRSFGKTHREATTILAAAVNNVKGDNGALKPILAEQGPVMLGSRARERREDEQRNSNEYIGR